MAKKKKTKEELNAEKRQKELLRGQENYENLKHSVGITDDMDEHEQIARFVSYAEEHQEKIDELTKAIKEDDFESAKEIFENYNVKLEKGAWFDIVKLATKNRIDEVTDKDLNTIDEKADTSAYNNCLKQVFVSQLTSDNKLRILGGVEVKFDNDEIDEDESLDLILANAIENMTTIETVYKPIIDGCSSAVFYLTDGATKDKHFKGMKKWARYSTNTPQKKDKIFRVFDKFNRELRFGLENNPEMAKMLMEEFGLTIEVGKMMPSTIHEEMFDKNDIEKWA